MCMLRSNGKTEEIARITTDPKFYCFTCAAEANCAETSVNRRPSELRYQESVRSILFCNMRMAAPR